MSRIIVITLVFNTPEMVEGALQCHYPGNYERFMIYCGFPGYTFEDYIPLANKYNCTYFSIKNEGVAQNWNHVKEVLSLKDGDIMIGLEADERPEIPPPIMADKLYHGTVVHYFYYSGWIEAIVNVMRHDPTIGFVGLQKTGYESEHNINDFHPVEIGGIKCRQYHSMIAWMLGGFSVRCINQIGGLKQEGETYGYLEHATARAMAEKGFGWVVLEDYYSQHVMSSEVYTEWKNLNRNRQNPKPYEQWLKERNGEQQLEVILNSESAEAERT